MVKKLFWVAAAVAIIGAAISMGPDLQRYYKISTM